MTFEEWKDSYGLIYERNYCEDTEFDCKAAFAAGAASRDAEIASLVNRTDYWRDLAKARDTRIAELEAVLNAIRAFAHDRSRGPAIKDALWEVRNMAYELLRK